MTAGPGGGEAQLRVGIVSWNTAALLDACLASLPDALGGTEAEVVVVDNASSDDSVEVARRRGVKVVANRSNRGYAAAMNQALAPPRPPVVVALNPDTVLPAGSLQRLWRILVDGPADVALVAPRLSNPDGTQQHSVGIFGSPAASAAIWFLPRRVLRRGLGQRLWVEGLAAHDRAQDVDWAVGAVHVIRSSALAGRPAPYDESWFMYVEDVELCWWLRAHGWRCRLEPSVQVVHVGNASGAQRWGDDRTRIYMTATYEWYARDRGGRAARSWAAVNVAGCLYWSAAHALVGTLTANRAMVGHAGQVISLLPVHLRGLIGPARPWSRPGHEALGRSLPQSGREDPDRAA